MRLKGNWSHNLTLTFQKRDETPKLIHEKTLPNSLYENNPVIYWKNSLFFRKKKNVFLFRRSNFSLSRCFQYNII